jgi:2-aminoadipate transaminase
MSEFTFDHWQKLYATRVSKMKVSAIREMLAVSGRPDIISFAGGLPDMRVFPAQQIAEATQQVMLREGAAALQYGTSEGHEGLRRHIVTMMSELDVEIDIDDLIILDGAQQGLEFLAKILIGPGDTIIIEGPSYVGALQAFSGYEPNFVVVPLDDMGMRMDILEEKLEELKRDGIQPKFVYTVPTFQNPAGVTMVSDRRRRLIELSARYEFIIIEDDPYGRLRFDGPPEPVLRSMDDNVVYLGTLSKIFSPGMRLGWVVAPRPILDKLTLAKQAGNLCTSSFVQCVTEEYLSTCDWRANFEAVVGLYHIRRDAMLAALTEYFPDGSAWTRPAGGLFIWATLPNGLDTGELLADSIREAKVAFVPGSACFEGGGGKSSMRLNFSYCEPETIDKGVKHLGVVVKRQLALYRSLFRGYSPGAK